MPFTTIVTEGGLLPADILDAIAAGELEGQRPEDFGLERTRNLSDRISAAWQAARGQWALFQTYLADLPAGETATTETREQWVLPLLRVLGYQLARNRSAYLVQGRTFAISHRAGNNESDDGPPIHVESIRNSLDARPPSGRPRLSPHALVQEYLNSTEQLWGIVTNGERLRLLRDSSRFTRPAYVEFDLRSMLEGEKFSEFALLYRLLHRSRLPVSPDEAASCLLEKYHQRAVEAGGRVREGLRDGVESALKRLGDGLLRHPANAELRAKLAKGLETGSDGDGSLTPLGYYRQLLRLVYRLLFLMVAEERGLIAAEEAYHKDTQAQRPEDTDESLWLRAFVVPAPDTALRIYYDHYSVGRLRRLAETSGAGRGPYTDLWDGLLTTFRLLEGSDESAPRRLGLAPLDGDLFGDSACAALTTNTRLANADLLTAIRALSLYREKESKALRRVNYGALDVEELGSVYESLLDYRPVVQVEEANHKGTKAQRPEHVEESLWLRAFVVHFDLVAGTERKTTGSYYTRPELVQELIKSALVPVLEERLKAAGPDPKAREAAILALRVCDPACGSGHFLLAAARRLGRELARVRAGEDQPSPTQFRRAVRDVTRRCIFGVDLNPLAVDLCKLALWLEGHAAGLPLSFLDHHIRHGNSLVGATRELVEAGIPDEAYKPVTGDDKATASSIRKRNKLERQAHERGQAMLPLDFADTNVGLADALRTLDEAADDSVAAVRARAARYAALRSTASPERAKFDLWTAAFFQPLTPENARYVPTSKDLIDFDPAGEKALMAAPLAEEVGFFHWELEFPQVFGAANHKDTKAQRPEDSESLRLGAFVVGSGFDVVLGNPPWERIKLQEQEHFVDVPAIAGAANKAARDKAITAWRNGDERQRARIALFDAAKYRAEAESRFVRASARFPLTAVGDVNTYALFAEHSRNLLAPSGRAGIIVPTGIATDESTKEFFGDLTTRRQLVSLYDFENREKIFSEVDSRFKFALLTIGLAGKSPKFLFFATNIEHLSDEKRLFVLDASDIALINPNTRGSPLFRTGTDAELTKKIYRQTTAFLNSDNLLGWKPTFFKKMIDFGIHAELINFEAEPPDSSWLGIQEAKMIWFFDHRFATYDGVSEQDRKSGNARALTLREQQNSQVRAKARYWVSKTTFADRIKGRSWRHKWFISFRDVARATDERTAIFAIRSFEPAVDKCPSLFVEESVQKISCLVANMSSLCLDYVSRQKVGGTNLGAFIVEQLPVLPPDRFTPEDIAYIVPRVVELVYTAWDIRAFAEDVWAEGDEALRALIMERRRANHEDTKAQSPEDFNALCLRAFVVSSDLPPPFIWHEGRRAVARAELDARIARLYGLTRDELRYILDPADVYGPDFPGETFRVLKEKETKLYGEYRTRRLVLEAWDAEEGRR